MAHYVDLGHLLEELEEAVRLASTAECALEVLEEEIEDELIV